MKKILFLIPLVILSGCNSSNKNEEVMLEYAKTYYTNHMVMIGSDTVSITKQMLEDASIIDNYDMSKLSSCKGDSKVIFSIENGKIENVEYNLNCE
ncbi:MAG: hypothetical protein NC181_04025 [Clostridium sp.]|nr:hypothetical protein [Clostridium sp.]MCM1444365.1 hypothetical protein [Candidatus Amulumruptor caecigallinarius]